MAVAEPQTQGPLPGSLHAFLEAAGFNACGVLERGDYDALVPEPWQSRFLLPRTRSVLVLGAGGHALFDAFQRAPEAQLMQDPLDAYTRRVADACVTRPELGAARAVCAFERRGEDYADFVALGRAAGLGAPSRLGLLVHPRFGPWLSLRALVLCERALAPTPPLVDFAPCDGCPAPCARVCHGAALHSGRFDTRACLATRLRESACEARCDARRACVVGPEHAYLERAEAHHMRSSGLLAAAQ